VYFNDGTGRKYQRVPFGDGKGAMASEEMS
jgi:hypothetical protein